MNRHRIACVIAASTLLWASAVDAQPQQPPGPSGVPIDMAQGEAAHTANMVRLIRTGIAKLNRAGEATKVFYDARHARDPSQPTFEQAVRAAYHARFPEYAANFDNVFSSQTTNDFRGNMQSIITAYRPNAPPLNNGTNADRQAVLANTGDFFLNAWVVDNQTNLEVFTFLANILEAMTYDQERFGLPHQVRLDVDSAQQLFDYNFNTEITHARQAQNNFRNAVPAITRTMEADGVFGHIEGLEPYVREEGNYRISIRTDGQIDMWEQGGAGIDDVFTQMLPGLGEPISPLRREAILKFIRDHFSDPNVLQEAMDHIDRINSRARGSNSLVAGLGGDPTTLADIDRLIVNGQLPRLTWPPPSAFEDFLNNGGSLTTIQLLEIYAGYDPFNPTASLTTHAGQSLSAAGTSPSTVMITPSSAGMSPSSVMITPSSAGSSPSLVGNTPAVHWGNGSAVWHTPGVDWGGGSSAVTSTPAVEWGGGMSLAGSPTMSLAGGPITINPASATTVNRHSASNGLFVDLGYGSGYQLQRDANGRLGRASADSRLVAMINDLRTDEILRVLRTSGQAGLNQLLAQPFNVLLTWGPGAYDIDLHLTGPTGVVGSDRFHIYYAARGSLEGPPFAELIRDCICTSGSEVILLSRLNQGGVYRISAFDFGNQSTTSTELTTNAGLQLQIVRGGTAVSVGNGTTIQGGHVVFAGQPSPGEVGNTWVGVEVDPRNGSVRFVNRTRNSTGGGGGIE